MLLRDAFLRGETLKVSDCCRYLEYVDGGYIGCGLGGIVMAISPKELWPALLKMTVNDLMDVIRVQYPWFLAWHDDRITDLYNKMSDGIISKERLADIIGEIETREVKREARISAKEAECFYSANTVAA